MANCPKCGSGHIQLKPSSSASWGTDVSGHSLFGVVIGSGVFSPSANFCLDCGTSWKAQDLYDLVQVISRLTGVSLDLKRERHRTYLNNFIAAITFDLQRISAAERMGKENVDKVKKEIMEKFSPVKYSSMGCVSLLVGFILLSYIASEFKNSDLFGYGMWTLFGLFVTGCIVDRVLFSRREKLINSAIQRAEAEASALKIQAYELLRVGVTNFMENNPLD